MFFATLISHDLVAQRKVKKSVRQKVDRESTTFRNAYQDLTARYNGYFNANLILQESIKKLEESKKDNYTALLPVFEYEGGDKANSVHSQMDVVIKKAAVDIKIHPNSKWVDDCYLLIGQAYYLKGDYAKATENLEYINRKFGNNIRIHEWQKKDKEGVDKKRTYPSINAKGGVNVGGNKVSTEDVKKELEKKRAKDKAKKESDKKKREQKREKEKAEREKEKKDLERQRAKERKELEKERAKERKEKEKERERAKKEKEKEMKQREKDRARLKKMSTEEKREYYAREKERKAREKEEKAQAEAEEIQRKLEEAEAKAQEKEMEEEEAEEEIAEAEAKSDEEEAPKPAEKLTEKEIEEEVKKDAKSKSSKKRKTPKAKAGTVGHKLARHEALLWLARTYMAQEYYDKAKAALDAFEDGKKIPRKLHKAQKALLAEYYLSQDQKTEAYAALDDAIDATRGRKNKARFHYVQAQLKAEESAYDLAAESFKKVIKSRPEYEMEFNARINLARTKMLAGEFDSNEAKRYLEKMLKDEKNEDYADQIYMAMADIEIANGNIDEAFALLKDATKNSTINKEQKGLAFLKIAELYFDKEEFLLSSQYYDSTAAFLPKDYPNYQEIADRKDILANLARHITTVEVEDSLQRIAAMPEGRRNAFIDDLIAEYEAEVKKRQAEKEAQEAANQGTDILDNANNQQNNTGKWYFYNDIAKSQGFNTFKARWGNRPLQDDWRRNAGQINFNNEESEGGEVASTENPDGSFLELAETGGLNRDIMLGNLPLTEAAMEQSHSKIMYALFEAGNIYKDQLKNNEKAIATYNELLKRYPKSKYTVQTHYALYLIHKNDGNTTQANVHKQYVLANDKEGIFANLIEDPNYAKIIKAQNKELLEYYEQTYDMYLAGNFDQVVSRSDEATQKFQPNIMAPQFDLLKAFVVGQTDEKRKYVNALKDIIKKHAEDPVSDKAQEILSYIEKGGKIRKQPTNPKKGIYNVDHKASHYFVIAFNGFVNGINKTVNNFTDYNTANNSLDKLNVTQMLLDPKNQILLIKTFKDGDKAMEYYTKVKEKEAELLNNSDGVAYKSFVISKKNFTQFFKSKDAELYYTFFLENYQGEE